MWILEQLTQDGVDFEIPPNAAGEPEPAAIVVDPSVVRIVREFCLAPISASDAGAATTFVCGRKQCDLNFEEDKSVSRKHARFHVSPNYEYTRASSRPPLLVEDGVDSAKFSSYGTRVYRSDGCENGLNKNRFALVASLSRAHKEPFDLSRNEASDTQGSPDYLVLLGRGWQGQGGGGSTVLRVAWQPVCIAHTSMPKDELGRCKQHAKALGVHIISARKGSTGLPDSTTHLAVGGGAATATIKTLHALVREIPLVAGADWLSHVRDRLANNGPLVGVRADPRAGVGAGVGAGAASGGEIAAVPGTFSALAADFAPRDLPPQASTARRSLFAGCLAVFFGGSDAAPCAARDVFEAGAGKARRVEEGASGGADDAALCRELLAGAMSADTGVGAGAGAVSTARKPAILLISSRARVVPMTERASMPPETEPCHADAGNERLCRVEALLARTAECRSNLVDVFAFDRESDIVQMMWEGMTPSTMAAESRTIGNESRTVGRRVVAVQPPPPPAAADASRPPEADSSAVDMGSSDAAPAKAAAMTATQMQAAEDADTEDDQGAELSSPERHPQQAPDTTPALTSAPAAEAPPTAGHAQKHSTTPQALPEAPEPAMQVEQAQEARAPRSAQKRKRPEHEQNDDTGAEAVPASQPHRPRPRQRQRKAAKPRAGQGWSCKQRSKEQTSQARAGASAGGGVIGAPADEGAGEDAQLMAPTLLCDDLDDCLDRDAELAGAETVGTDALDGIAMREVVRGGVNFKAFRKTPYHPYAQEEVVEITDGAGHKVNLNRHHVNQLRRSYEQEEQREQRADELWREDVSRPRGRARGRSRR